MDLLLERLQQHAADVVRARPGQAIRHRAGHFYTEQAIADGWMMWVSRSNRELRELDEADVEGLYLAYRRHWLAALRKTDTAVHDIGP